MTLSFSPFHRQLEAQATFTTTSERRGPSRRQSLMTTPESFKANIATSSDPAAPGLQTGLVPPSLVASLQDNYLNFHDEDPLKQPTWSQELETMYQLLSEGGWGDLIRQDVAWTERMNEESCSREERNRIEVEQLNLRKSHLGERPFSVDVGTKLTPVFLQYCGLRENRTSRTRR